MQSKGKLRFGALEKFAANRKKSAFLQLPEFSASRAERSGKARAKLATGSFSDERSPLA